MGSYKHIRQTMIAEYKERPQAYKDKLILWGTQGTIVKVERPSNIARARRLGYKAKEGVIVVRVGVNKGRSKRKTASGGRKPSKSGRYFSRAKSNQAIAEERAARRFSNFEVMNSYFAGESGAKVFFEIILLNRVSPSVLADKNLSRIVQKKNRAFAGLTSVGRQHRGL